MKDRFRMIIWSTVDSIMLTFVTYAAMVQGRREEEEEGMIRSDR